jgi:NTP pyrophosphatase (non-canonical NTP hydrolase)
VIELEPGAPLARYQSYINELEALHGWLDVDLVHNCFLMGEEVGELFKAVRRYNRLFEQGDAEPVEADDAKAHVGEEIVDVMNYLFAIANRLDLDLEASFRKKNAANQKRSWQPK